MTKEILVIGLIWIAISAVSMFKNRRPKQGNNYIWVGPGENPFKK